MGMAGRAERHQPVEIEVRAPLGALDDVVDLEGAPAATGLAPPLAMPECCTSLGWLTPAAHLSSPIATAFRVNRK